MPELAPVTRAFWPWRTLRMGQEGNATAGKFSSDATGFIAGPPPSGSRFKGLHDRTLAVCYGTDVFGNLFAARLQQLGDQPGPAGLMRGADPTPRVAVEVLVK